MTDEKSEPSTMSVVSEKEHPVAQQRALNLVLFAWIFGAAWMYTVSGAALTRFAQLLRMPELGFGLMTALPAVGALFQVPASYFLERFGRHKPVFIAAGVAHRTAWVLIALIPWFVPEHWGWIALLGLMLFSSISGNITGPAWVAWMAALVPSAIRGRYFSNRNRLGQMVGVIVTPLIAYILDRSGAVSSLVMLRSISVLLAAAGVAGVIDFLFFTGVPIAIAEHPQREVNALALFAQPLKDRNFRRFLAYTATLTLGIGYITQFVWLYLFDVLRMTNSQANLVLVIAPLLCGMLFFPLWGRLLDRFGRKPTLIIACLLVTPASAAWLFATREFDPSSVTSSWSLPSLPGRRSSWGISTSC
jgi:MFS family permease